MYKNGYLEIWNVETGEFYKAESNYSIQDFSTDGKSILLIGEGFMQMTKLEKILKEWENVKNSLFDDFYIFLFCFF